MTDCDYHRVVWIEIFWVELVVVRFDHGAACIAILIFYFVEFVLHYLLAKLWIVQDLIQIIDGLHQFVEFIMQLLQTESSQLRQAHINNSLTLNLVQFEALLQIALCIRRSLACADDMNNFVDIIACDDKTFQDMSTLLCFLQLVLGTADCYVMTVLYKVLDTFLESKQTRTSLDEGYTVDRE